jgi:hypothetical protein
VFGSWDPWDADTAEDPMVLWGWVPAPVAATAFVVAVLELSAPSTGEGVGSGLAAAVADESVAGGDPTAVPGSPTDVDGVAVAPGSAAMAPVEPDVVTVVFNPPLADTVAEGGSVAGDDACPDEVVDTDDGAGGVGVEAVPVADDDSSPPDADDESAAEAPDVDGD